MQTRSGDEKAVCLSVRLSVCPSVKPVHCDKTDERSVQIFVSYEISFSLHFWEKNGCWGRPKILIRRPLLEQNRLFSTDIRS